MRHSGQRVATSALCHPYGKQRIVYLSYSTFATFRSSPPNQYSWTINVQLRALERQLPYPIQDSSQVYPHPRPKMVVVRMRCRTLAGLAQRASHNLAGTHARQTEAPRKARARDK